MSLLRAVLFLLPFFVSIAVSLFVAAYALRHGETWGARPFAVAMIMQALWVGGYAIELAVPSVTAKLLLDDLQWLFAIGWASFTVAFITAYIGKRWQKGRTFWIIVTAAPFAFLALLVTNGLHGIIRTEASIVQAEPFPVLEYPISPAMLALSAYLASLYLFAIIILVTHAARQHRLFRRQSLIILAGTLVPTVGGLLSMADVRIGLYRDVSPFTFTVSALVIGFGLLRFRLFAIGPVAREAIFHTVADPILVFDPLQRLVDANAPAAKLLGASTQEMVGRSAQQALHQQPELLQRIETGTGGEWSFFDAHIGGERSFDVTVRDIEPAKHISYGTLVMLHELTDIREAQAQLIEAREELARRERFSAVGKLLSKVAHDLRNPMATLRASLHTIREASGRDGNSTAGGSEWTEDRAPAAAISRAETTVTRLEAMTTELLNFEAQAPVRFSELSLENWIAELLEEYQPPDGVTTRTEVEPGLSLRADPIGLRRALLNLLSNAADATTTAEPSGGRIAVTARRHGSEIHLTVSDRGTGIATEHLDKMFEPLFTTKPRGMGLGMSIVRDVADSHRGRLEVDSAPGRGTTVSLILPAQNAEAPS